MTAQVQVTHTVTMTAYGTATVRDLAAFVAEVERAGMDPATAALSWSADRGDQREGPSLRLTATPGRGCRDHLLTQHRDGKPPWCRACGRTADGADAATLPGPGAR